MKRIEGLDFLRGFSILLMFADHILAIAFLEGIYPFGGRYWTRLSEPLFALLFGYFLVNRNRERLMARLVEIFGVALLINMGFYYATGKIEILGSFILAGITYLMLGERFKFLFPVVFFYSLDPSRPFLDYPVSLVFGQIAIGMWLREDWKKGLLFTLAYASAMFWVNPPWQYTVYFTLPAALLLVAFSNVEKLKKLKIEPINLMGRRPLLSYGLQYLLAITMGVLYLSATGKMR